MVPSLSILTGFKKKCLILAKVRNTDGFQSNQGRGMDVHAALLVSLLDTCLTLQLVVRCSPQISIAHKNSGGLIHLCIRLRRVMGTSLTWGGCVGLNLPPLP